MRPKKQPQTASLHNHQWLDWLEACHQHRIESQHQDLQTLKTGELKYRLSQVPVSIQHLDEINLEGLDADGESPL